MGMTWKPFFTHGQKLPFAPLLQVSTVRCAANQRVDVAQANNTLDKVFANSGHPQFSCSWKSQERRLGWHDDLICWNFSLMLIVMRLYWIQFLHLERHFAKSWRGSTRTFTMRTSNFSPPFPKACRYCTIKYCKWGLFCLAGCQIVKPEANTTDNRQ